MKKIVDGNTACANIAYLFSEICAIYPITPSSPMAQEIDVLSHTDKKNLFNESVSIIEMQSEAGAAGALHGSLLAGSLSTTFTSSQGLLLMIPNMYKIAGEMLPGVMHVAARTVATHALSIFGDHSDVYATRGTGFCMLASTNVKDAHNLAAVAHLSAIEGSLPFMHFFDGFRTSHEINTIDMLKEKDIISLINYDKVYEFKNKVLNVGCNKQRGMAENEDIYFQSVEARNTAYNEMPDIVNSYMTSINELTGLDYKPFNYYGDKGATNIIVAMGSVCDTVKLVVDDLISKGEKVGLIEVHLYRPFSVKYLLNVLPASTKNIAVLDRTKESGSIGEPLYLDIVSALKDKKMNIVGGRYGLSSKNTTPSDIYSVFKMLEGELKNNFTIGIVDDVTNLSLPKYDYNLKLDAEELLIYGFGSDGMVSTSKDIMKLVGANTDKYVESYNQYDSKKSGGVTICNLRISDSPINAPFYVTNPDIVVITKEEYLYKFDMINNIKENGIVLINTMKKGEIAKLLPNKVKRIINERHVKLFVVDASQIAIDAGIKGKISKIMEMIILKLLNFDNAYELLSESIKKQFATKGQEIITANLTAISNALSGVMEVVGVLDVKEDEDENKFNVIEMINRRRGDELAVSDLLPYADGTFPGALSKYEKRRISTYVPKWNSDNCIECGQCSLVCPHAVIRPFALKDSNAGIPMLGNTEYKFEIVVSEADCTSCGLCINTCPGKNGEKALSFGLYDDKKQKRANELFNNYTNPQLFDKFTIKGSQFIKPKFEFNGACGGCGEPSYIKLLTQLFQDKLIIANATGCSSIYGGSCPSTPYGVPWANSLFEDNAEFGYGMLLSYNKTRNRIKNIMENSINSVNQIVKANYERWLNNPLDFAITMEVKNKLKDQEIPIELKKLMNYIPARSVWTIGGDGWAYDIGFGGIDHVLSSGEDVNILVLDTEVYSNTGGQASKSSHFGAVAQFADFGKKTAKKDLFRIAMSYPNCYVANVSFGSNFMQTIKAFKEAESHKGPSIIIAYSPCLEHGISGGLGNSIKEEKMAVEVGYTTLMRYIPEEKKLYIDSKEPDFNKYEEFLNNEVRYRSLKVKDEKLAKVLLERNKEEAIERYNYYKDLANKN